MDMQRSTYCAAAMAAAEAEGCPPDCIQQLLHVVDCSLGLWDGETCISYAELLTRVGLCERVVSVGPLASDFTDLQDAFDSIDDAAIDRQYVVRLCPGIYTGNFVMPNYVHLEAAVAHRGACRLQSAAGVTLTVPNGSGCRIHGVAIESTGGTALAFPVAAAPEYYFISDCWIRGDYIAENHDLVTIAGVAANITFLNGTRFEYYETGDTGAPGNWHRAVYATVASLLQFHNCIWDMEVDDDGGIIVGFEAAAGAAVEHVIQSCEARIHADNVVFAGAAGFYYEHGVGFAKHVECNHIHLIADSQAGLGYGIFLDSSNDAGIIHATSNHIQVEGFGNNFSYHAGNGDQICSGGEFLNCAQGTSTAGTGVVDLASSEACGELSATENVWVGGTPAGVPAANTLYRDNIVKGWINFNGTGVIAIRDSFNVSGIVDNGVGNYTVTWDTDFANTNYCCVLEARWNGASVLITSLQTIAVGSVSIWVFSHVPLLTDSDTVMALAIGDQ